MCVRSFFNFETGYPGYRRGYPSRQVPRGRADRNGAKIEMHRGERYKWDAVPRTRRTRKEEGKKKKKKKKEEEEEVEEMHRNNRTTGISPRRRRLSLHAPAKSKTMHVIHEIRTSISLSLSLSSFSSNLST